MIRPSLNCCENLFVRLRSQRRVRRRILREKPSPSQERKHWLRAWRSQVLVLSVTPINSAQQHLVGYVIAQQTSDMIEWPPTILTIRGRPIRSRRLGPGQFGPADSEEGAKSIAKLDGSHGRISPLWIWDWLDRYYPPPTDVRCFARASIHDPGYKVSPSEKESSHETRPDGGSIGHCHKSWPRNFPV